MDYGWAWIRQKRIYHFKARMIVLMSLSTFRMDTEMLQHHKMQLLRNSSNHSATILPKSDNTNSEFSLSSIWGSAVSSNNTTVEKPPQEMIVVSWSEINTALGAIALLLHIISSPKSLNTCTSSSSANSKISPQQQYTSPIHFSRTIYPRGSYSKISLSIPDDNVQKVENLYNLYYQYQRFPAFFFARRNFLFNIAVNTLAVCTAAEILLFRPCYQRNTVTKVVTLLGIVF